MSELYNRTESFKVEQIKTETFMATMENIKLSEEMTIERADDIFSRLLSNIDDEDVASGDDSPVGKSDFAAEGSDSAAFKSFYDENIDQFDGKTREQVYEEFSDQYEFFDKWLKRDDEESHISLENFNEMECQRVYGDTSPYDDDDDSNDSY